MFRGLSKLGRGVGLLALIVTAGERKRLKGKNISILEDSKESLRHSDTLRSREHSREQNGHGRFGMSNNPEPGGGGGGNGKTEAGRGKELGMSPEDME